MYEYNLIYYVKLKFVLFTDKRYLDLWMPLSQSKNIRGLVHIVSSRKKKIKPKHIK